MGGAIRPLVIGVVWREGALLVSEGRDDVKGEVFHRPLGGGIEFGETGATALRREFREELGAEITAGECLGVLENIFTWRGTPGHEIVLVHAAAFADPAWYGRDAFTVLDTGSAVRWVPFADFRDGRAILYPDGLTGLLSGTPAAP